MPKWKVFIGLPSSKASVRAEVLGWVIECQRVAHQDERIRSLIDDELLVAPIQAFPTSVARNRLVEAARQHKADIAFMVDDDAWLHAEERGPDGRLVRDGWFASAILFLTSQPEPSVVACPYCCGGQDEEVMAFEFTQNRTGAALDVMPPTFALTRIHRMDAARRKGYGRVANIGTHAVAYDMRVFDRIKKPYYAYQFNADHTALVETEDCWAHRLMFNEGVPIWCDWDRWAKHHKDTWVNQPLPMPQEMVPENYRKQAEANLRYNRPGEPTAKPFVAPRMSGGWNMDQAERLAQVQDPKAWAAPHNLNHGPDRSGKIEVKPSPAGSAVQAGAGNSPPPPPVDPFAAQTVEVRNSPEYERAATEIGPRPTLQPQPFPFSCGTAALWAKSVEGWMTFDELKWIAEQANKLKAGDRWVEVGVWKGRSLSAVVLAAQDGLQVAAVDRWDGAHFGPTAANAVLGDFTLTLVELCRLRPGVPVEQRREDSRFASGGFVDASCAAVFLDAGQSPAEVRANVNAWLPKVRAGGLLCGHDALTPGTGDVLRELLGGGVAIGPGSLWSWRKPEVVPVVDRHRSPAFDRWVESTRQDVATTREALVGNGELE